MSFQTDINSCLIYLLPWQADIVAEEDEMEAAADAVLGGVDDSMCTYDEVSVGIKYRGC